MAVVIKTASMMCPKCSTRRVHVIVSKANVVMCLYCGNTRKQKFASPKNNSKTKTN